ncbi:hypothetical protein BXZ70DRAFT_935507 [Cristinia sonorae]|uniref:BBC1/AIM3 cysteine proteinase-fold domain-containing protein n=1 Tax=Cristinia sonorae TaxID=1940300 RepID=A0A8K0XQD6_9AGAR|nr:hypothetical protein BXZ70DRAFT_935507 [Cristinia sonorae]
MNSLRNLSVPTVGDIKKARDIGKSKFSETRDRFSSQPSRNFDTSAKPPPPPPPPGRSPASHDRTSSMTARSSFAPPPSHPSPPPPSAPSAPPLPQRQSSGSSAGVSPSPPPPVARRFPRPDDSTASHSASPLSRNNSTGSDQTKIDWTNLTQEDKLAFFALLDEYFESRRGVGGGLTVPSVGRGPSQSVKHVEELGEEPGAPPPPIRAWSRPKPRAASPAPDEFTLSFPPPTQYGSAGLDLAHFFSPQTHWDSAWYKLPNGRPPLAEGVPAFMSSWETHGMQKTLYGGIRFADLSMAWYSVAFSTSGNADPNDIRSVKRFAEYLPCPQPMSGPALVEASETYGETVAGFAESYEGTGEYCERGECWDLADQALKYFKQFDYVPEPVPSTSCAHGHLIFSGKATSLYKQWGKWRGGDDRVRRGDILQWRSAKVNFPGGGYATLGSPDHTAVIVAEAIPSETVEDGKSVKPAAIGVLEVVEQSVGSPPARQRYDLSQMIEGEVWIYRPVGLVEYLGTALEARCPEGVNALRV